MAFEVLISREDQFNSVCYWAATEKCYKQNNYNTILALVSGLKTSAVARLKQCWEAVESKGWKQVEDLVASITPEHDHRVYRHDLEASMPNCIPILSLYRKDILFMNDGNPKMIYASDTGLCGTGIRMQMKIEKGQSEGRAVPDAVLGFSRGA
ncbi:ras guanine nucleotide exchange factor domain-containing protein [Cladochytrium replicatum]|nr:ras guanine nucleotide exchange factor domain-containing protein [Cladochytrium replicatum]